MCPCVPKVPGWGLARLTVEVCGTFSSVPGHSAAHRLWGQEALSSMCPSFLTQAKLYWANLSRPSRQLNWLIHPGAPWGLSKDYLGGCCSVWQPPSTFPREHPYFEDWAIMTMCSIQNCPGVWPAGWARQHPSKKNKASPVIRLSPSQRTYYLLSGWSWTVSPKGGPKPTQIPLSQLLVSGICGERLCDAVLQKLHSCLSCFRVVWQLLLGSRLSLPRLPFTPVCCRVLTLLFPQLLKNLRARSLDP